MSTAIKDDLGDDETAANFFNQDTSTSSNNIKKILNEHVKNLFRIESKYLNSDNEMIRMFGAKIVQAERAAVSGYVDDFCWPFTFFLRWMFKKHESFQSNIF